MPRAALNFFAAAAPLFHAMTTSGWNEKIPMEFTVQPDRTFVWRSGSVERTGSIPRVALNDLIAHVRSAMPGRPANDAGTLQLTWRAASGKVESKVFYFPASPPALSLVKEINDDAGRYAVR